jgi:hypothetical protein
MLAAATAPVLSLQMAPVAKADETTVIKRDTPYGDSKTIIKKEDRPMEEKKVIIRRDD